MKESSESKGYTVRFSLARKSLSDPESDKKPSLLEVIDWLRPDTA